MDVKFSDGMRFMKCFCLLSSCATTGDLLVVPYSGPCVEEVVARACLEDDIVHCGVGLVEMGPEELRTGLEHQ